MASPRLNVGRRSEPGYWYVITTVTLGRQSLFVDADLASALIEQLARVAPDVAETHAWVVMPEHLHWMFQLKDSLDLSRIVQGLKSRSAISINRRRRASAQVWQPGFYDHRLREDEDLEAQARYIVANPVRRGLVVRIEDYPHWWRRWITSTSDY